MNWILAIILLLILWILSWNPKCPRCNTRDNIEDFDVDILGFVTNIHRFCNTCKKRI